MVRAVVLGHILLATIATVVQWRAAEANTVGCPEDLPHTTAIKRFGESCYQFVSQEKFWFEARRYCHQYGGRLAKIDNAATNAFIVSSLNGLWWRNNGVWIGLHDLNREMQFQWSGYSPYENEPVGGWTNWGHGHPGAFLHSFRDCVRMVRGGGQWEWHETPCNAMRWHYRFICEYKAVVNTESVQLGLMYNSPVPENRLRGILTTNAEASTLTSLEPSTAASPTTVQEENGEESVYANVMDYNGHEEEWLEPVYNYKLMIEDTTQKLENTKAPNNHDDNLELTDVMFLEQNAEKDDDRKVRNVSLALSIVVCSVVSCFLLIVAILLYRRRKNQEKMNKTGIDDETTTKKSAEQKPRMQSAVSNVYVIGDVNMESHLASDDSEETMSNDGRHATDALHEDSGMMGYDEPNTMNLYNEINETYFNNETDHVYESLDDIVA